MYNIIYINRQRILLTISMLILITHNASAQWWVNPPNLQTSGTMAVFSTSSMSSVSYTDVVINNHLAVFVISPDCPITTGSTSLADYPFVVNSIQATGTTADGAAIVLWDTTGDNMRKIIGLSQAGGVSMFSGDNVQNSSAINLFSLLNVDVPAGIALVFGF